MSARLWNPHREQMSRVEPWTGPSHEVSSASHQTAPEPEQSRNFTNCLFIYCKFKKLKWNQTLKHSSVCPQSLRHQHDDISFIINDLKTKFTSCLLQFGCLLLLILWIVTMTAQQFLCCRKTVITVVILVSCDITADRPIKPPALMVTWTDAELLSMTAALLLELVSGDDGNVSAPWFCWV